MTFSGTDWIAGDWKENKERKVMFQREEIMFRRHTVLKAEMFSFSCQAPMEYLELQYRGWFDGILADADVLVGEKDLMLQPGIVIYKGNMFRMTKIEHIPYQANGKEMKLWLHFGECKENESGKFYETDFLLTEETQMRAGDMELVRFCLQEGAILRDKYKNFEDMNTQYNTLNYIYATYSGYQQKTISPIILREFAEEAQECSGLEAEDIAFLMECNRGQNVSKHTIRLYLEYKLNKKLSPDCDNLEIYESLKQVLKIVRTPKRKSTMSSGRRIMID